MEAHDLVHEFPEHKEKIHTLKMEDNHFRALFDDYHEVNKEIIRAETDVEPISDEHAEELKKKRLMLKDNLFELLQS